jgi:uncharacterized membrane protein
MNTILENIKYKWDAYLAVGLAIVATLALIALLGLVLYMAPVAFAFVAVLLALTFGVGYIVVEKFDL